MWKMNLAGNRESERGLRIDGENQGDHLIPRKWTEPHKASFLYELAAVEGATVEKALLI